MGKLNQDFLSWPQTNKCGLKVENATLLQM